MKLRHLRCESRRAPLGIGPRAPRLSWKFEASEGCFEESQTAYQIVASGSPRQLAAGDYDRWDSGRIEAVESLAIPYAGSAASHAEVYWKVFVWDQNGQQIESEGAYFTFGLLDPDAEWQADFIRFFWNPTTPLLRKPFRVEKALRRAILYSTALGVYEMHLNGAKVGLDRLTPGWTDYHRTLYYQAYEVADQLVMGQNAIGGVLGAGWYAGFFGPFEDKGYWGAEAYLSAQLHLFYEDGTEEVVVTDGTWKGCPGPILRSDLLMGEEYDARKEEPGWCHAGFDDTAWASVWLRTEPIKAKLLAQPAPTLQQIMELPAREVSEPQPGLFVFDLGQNMVGHIRLQITAPAGTRLTIRHGEMLRADGTVYTENLRSAKATEVYLCKGAGVEVWAPRFTFHGFRYVEIEGCPQTPDIDMVTGVVLMSALEPTGHFACSDERVNQLFRNIVWGMRGNYFDVPIDCPQRDERLGWTGDSHMFARTATYLYDVSAFLPKWLKELNDAQRADGAFPNCAPYMGRIAGGNAAWDDTGVIIPYILWKVYGDRRFITESWPHMERFMEFLITPGNTHNSEKALTYGDWLNRGEETSHRCLGVAFHAYDARLMAEMAEAIGDEASAIRYRERFDLVKTEFNERFVDPEGRIDNNTQTAYALALHFGLLDETAMATRHLIENLQANESYLKTGFVGTSYLAHVLTQVGRSDLAYTLLLNDGYPSWLYSVKNGATTVWERWNSWTKEDGFGDIAMNSFNHYAFGSIAEWMFRVIAGIDLAAPGFGKLRVEPRMDPRLTHARAEFDSPHGQITSAWRLDGGQLTVDLQIPPSTRAQVILPNGDTYEVGSGTYSYVIAWTP